MIGTRADFCKRRRTERRSFPRGAAVGPEAPPELRDALVLRARQAPGDDGRPGTPSLPPVGAPRPVAVVDPEFRARPRASSEDWSPGPPNGFGVTCSRPILDVGRITSPLICQALLHQRRGGCQVDAVVRRAALLDARLQERESQPAIRA